ncbi:hypothetical protein JCM16303_004000 [Sporobolomyces ruberrimus]
MANILDLPPEVVQEIFLVPFAKDPPHFYSQHRLRSRDLASFSLVHSRWRSLAQSLLVKEIWVAIRVQHRIAKDNAWSLFRKYKIRKLTVEGGLGDFTKVAENASPLWGSRWNDIRSLQVMRSSLSMGTLARFPNLETLELYGTTLKRPPELPSVRFPQLRSLILSGKMKFEGKAGLHQKHFSPTTMPELSHLALEVSETLDWSLNHPFPSCFARVLPQIKSIVLRRNSPIITRSYTEYTSSNVVYPRSYDQYLTAYFLPRFLLDTAGLELESLHISRAAIENRENKQIFEILAKQESKEEKVKVENLFVYGRGNVGDLRAAFGDETVITRLEDVEAPPLPAFGGR